MARGLSGRACVWAFQHEKLEVRPSKQGFYNKQKFPKKEHIESPDHLRDCLDVASLDAGTFKRETQFGK